MKLLALCLLTALTATAQSIWQPTPGHTQIPLWPAAAPDARPAAKPESMELTGPKDYVAGKLWLAVNDVSIPTLTLYPAQGRNTGATVVVFPGGGYQILAIDLEGTEVCDWLTSRGINCIVLKYRVTATGPYPKSGPYPESPMALEDAQRALGLIRLHAAAWRLDPHKIGVLGFSAGGHLVAALSNHFAVRLYPAVDAADALSCRPDFAVALYPGHLSLSAAEWDATRGVTPYPLAAAPPFADKELALNPDLHVTALTPPTFLLQAEDDHVDNVDDSLSYYIALKNAGVPAEMHLYAHGGHAFGLRPTDQPITGWPTLVEQWLHSIAMTP